MYRNNAERRGEPRQMCFCYLRSYLDIRVSSQGRCGPILLDMLRPVPPMSNNARQERFRAGHPGYFRKYKTSMRQFRREQERLAAFAALQSPPPETPKSSEVPPKELSSPESTLGGLSFDGGAWTPDL